MLFISAGFDAHRDDLLGGMALDEEDYAWITRGLMAVADKHADQRVVSMLEGGYNLQALGRSASAHVATLVAEGYSG
jgi:acetoin utilization deacetylase AcuC-like enzyme